MVERVTFANIFAAPGTAEVEVYSTIGCKFCRIAKAKLTELGVIFVNIDIQGDISENILSAADGDNKAKRISQRIGHAKTSTVPQIYVDDEHIGGCAELLEEVKGFRDGGGMFLERLRRKGVVWGPFSPAAEMTDVINNEGSNQSVPNYKPPLGEPLNSLHFKCVAPMQANSLEPPMTAVELSKKLQQRALVLADKFATADGKRVQYTAMRSSSEFAEYVSLSCRLQQCSLWELATLTHAEKLAFYVNLYNALIIHAICVLRIEELELAENNTSEYMANLTSPEANAQRSLFFTGATGAVYRIGGQPLEDSPCNEDLCETNSVFVTMPAENTSIDFTPDMIEHAVLRANRPHPSQVDAALLQDRLDRTATTRDASYYYNTLSYVPEDHPIVVHKLQLARERFDPRIHFILNCGAVSCPPIKVLDASLSPSSLSIQKEKESQEGEMGGGGNVDAALRAAAATYLHSEMSVNLEQKEICLPRLLLWYAKDFGLDLTSVLTRAAQLMSDGSEVKASLQLLLRQSSGEESEEALGVKRVIFLSENDQDPPAAQSREHDVECFKVRYNTYDWALNSA